MSGPDSESIEYDVVIVGGGPAGLAAAIRLRQHAIAAAAQLSVCVLEKAAAFGGHTLSGAVLDSRALDELLPHWLSDGAPGGVVVDHDEFHLLRDGSSAVALPHWLVPPPMRNLGRRVVSLGALCRWLSERAEQLDVDLLPGFAAAELAAGDAGVGGVLTGDRGISRSGDRKPTYEPGILIRAKQVVLAEGSRGHLARQLTERFSLDQDADPQHYAIGLKEIWEVDARRHSPGLVQHGAGWPLSGKCAGGFFCYHGDEHRVAVGLVVDLNYSNPYLNPYAEFQRLKHHPLFKETLESGRRVAYGARAITKGGLNSLPRLTVPGALLIGCDAGTLNFAKVKGIHTAMKSGMVAADLIFEAWSDERLAGAELTSYRDRLLDSWVGDELRRARNVQPALHRYGPLVGGALTYIEQTLFRGHAPWTLRDRIADHAATATAETSTAIEYPAPDGRLGFDLTTSVYLSNTYHDEDQPSHLTFKDATLPIAHNLPRYDAPEQRYCPAGVYEIVDDRGTPSLRVNAQNCLHCKVCDIKDPLQNIVWVPPEQGGPGYTNM